MSLYGVKFHIRLIMLKNTDVMTLSFQLVFTVIVCAGAGLWTHLTWFVREICWNLLRPFPNSQPVTLVSSSSCPAMVAGTDPEWITQPISPLSAWTRFLSSSTHMCMFSPSWPHYITTTDLSNLTRNDAQTPETQQLLEPPFPFLFVHIPLPSATLFPSPFFHC